MEGLITATDYYFYSRCRDRRQFYWNTQCAVSGRRGIFCGNDFIMTDDITDDHKSITTHLELNTFTQRIVEINLSEFHLGDLSEFVNLEFLTFMGDIREINFSSMDKLRTLVVSTRSLTSDGLLNLPSSLEYLIVLGTTCAEGESVKLNNLPQGFKKLIFVSACHYVDSRTCRSISRLCDSVSLPSECDIHILFGDIVVDIVDEEA